MRSSNARSAGERAEAAEAFDTTGPDDAEPPTSPPPMPKGGTGPAGSEPWNASSHDWRSAGSIARARAPGLSATPADHGIESPKGTPPRLASGQVSSAVRSVYPRLARTAPRRDASSP